MFKVRLLLLSHSLTTQNERKLQWCSLLSEKAF